MQGVDPAANAPDGLVRARRLGRTTAHCHGYHRPRHPWPAPHHDLADADHVSSDAAPCRVGPAKHPVLKGYLVHCVTASGAICGMFGIIAVADGEPGEAILWLAIAMVL